MTALPERHAVYGAFDIARGLAALAVVANHLRGFVFTNWSEASDHGLLWAAFYAMTSLGHQAVMVFFVLSGFFISRSVDRAIQAGNFSFLDYAVKRLGRLWIVLIPALVLTAFWDQLGAMIGGPSFYSGEKFEVFASGPTPAASASANTLGAFFANALFLQTIVTPPFGSNGPLWSLAYEFWYYVLCPFILIAFYPGVRITKRIMFAAVVLALLLLLPRAMVLYGLVWALGYLVHLASKRLESTTPLTHRLIAVGGLVSFTLSIGASLVTDLRPIWTDFAIATTFAIWMCAVAASPSGRKAPHALIGLIASSSYTLYLTHFPLIAFVSVTAINFGRYDTGATGLVVYTVIFAVALAYAFALYWLFERHTVQVQSRILRLVQRIRVTPHA